MQFYVTVKTTEGTQINHISAKSVDQAYRKVAKYNQRHPQWEMRLMHVAPASDEVLMPVELIDNPKKRRNPHRKAKSGIGVLGLVVLAGAGYMLYKIIKGQAQ